MKVPAIVPYLSTEQHPEGEIIWRAIEDMNECWFAANATELLRSLTAFYWLPRPIIGEEPRPSNLEDLKWRKGLPSYEQVAAHAARTKIWCEQQGYMAFEGGYWQGRQIPIHTIKGEKVKSVVTIINLRAEGNLIFANWLQGGIRCESTDGDWATTECRPCWPDATPVSW